MIFSNAISKDLIEIKEIENCDQFLLNQKVGELGIHFHEAYLKLVVASLKLNKKVILYKDYEEVDLLKIRLNGFKVTKNWTLLSPSLKNILKKDLGTIQKFAINGDRFEKYLLNINR